MATRRNRKSVFIIQTRVKLIINNKIFLKIKKKRRKTVTNAGGFFRQASKNKIVSLSLI